MAQLRCETLNDAVPQGKARVYFACHPEDHRRFFREITDQILRYSNCAVYYYDEEPELNDEYYANLNRMQLIIIPVTTRLLAMANRAMDVEFPYALIHHIPVLPVMLEPGLEKKYAEKFGNLQFLDKNYDDITAIPYEEKLKTYLSTVLLNDRQMAQVRAAFDAWVFLSYRKKDRHKAQKLMRLIHSDPRCRDIAIWYDEFLNPGEDFNESIRKALAESQLFVLAVTPNLLETGNYVMREEYPEARRTGKPILPAEMEKTDREALRKDFLDLPDPVDPHEDGAVTKAVLDALGALAVRENDEDPKHNFFIGLAYLSGLFVEKDQTRAVALITAAAEAGLTEAMEKLVTMYETGEGVEESQDKGIAWRVKITEQARQCYAKDPNTQTIHGYFSRLYSLGRALILCRKLHEAKMVCATLMTLSKECSHQLGADRASQWAALAYNLVGTAAMEEGNLCEAESWIRKTVDIYENLASSNDVRILCNLSVAYDRLGEVCWRQENWSEAKSWLYRAVETALRGAKTGSQEDLLNLKSRLKCLERLESYSHDYPEVRSWYLKDIQLMQELSQTSVPATMHALKNSYFRLARLCEKHQELEEAKQFYAQGCRILQQVVTENRGDDQYELVSTCEHLGDLCRKTDDVQGMKTWYNLEWTYYCSVYPWGGSDTRRVMSIVGWLNQDIAMLQKCQQFCQDAIQTAERAGQEDGIAKDQLISVSVKIQVLESFGTEVVSYERAQRLFLDAYGKAIGLNVLEAMCTPKPFTQRKDKCGSFRRKKD